GDRHVEDASGKSWVVAFTTNEQAQRFTVALAKLRQAQEPLFKDLAAKEVSPTYNLWSHPKGKTLSVQARGQRVWLLEAPSGAASNALRDRLEGPLPLSIYSRKEKRSISFGEMVDRLLDADLICVGETHDSEPHHAVQLRIIKALFAQDERLGVGLEMF